MQTDRVRRVAVIASSPGNGKTTLARQLAARLELPLVELDPLAYGPGWRETPADELLPLVSELVAGDRWVIDGIYPPKLGDLVPRSADTVVWLDLPIRVWLPRLLRRTVRRMRTGEELWHGNHERFFGAIVGRNPILVRALRLHRRRRREWPAFLAPFPVVRLRTPVEVEAFLESIPRGETDSREG